MRVLDDDDVRAAPASTVVAAAREALLQAGRGELAAPPRARTELGSVDYVFTAGGLADGTSGFRAYRAGQPAGDQLVAVWDAAGRLTGVVVGDELGARRTGALGAVAVDALSRPDAHTLGLVGTGRQAWTQLWAVAAVRELTRFAYTAPPSSTGRTSPPGPEPNWTWRPARPATRPPPCTTPTSSCWPPGPPSR